MNKILYIDNYYTCFQNIYDNKYTNFDNEHNIKIGYLYKKNEYENNNDNFLKRTYNYLLSKGNYYYNDYYKSIVSPHKLSNKYSFLTAEDILYNNEFKNILENVSSININCNLNVELKNLPVNLKNLYLSGAYTGTLDNIPLSLEHLEVRCKNEQDFNFTRLINLKSLYFNDNYNFTNINFPNSLEKLSIYSNKNIDLTNCKNLISLTYYNSNYYTESKNNFKKIKILNIPNSIIYLKLSKNIELENANLKNMTNLKIFECEDCEIDKLNLPDSIEVLILKNCKITSWDTTLQNLKKKYKNIKTIEITSGREKYRYGKYNVINNIKYMI